MDSGEMIVPDEMGEDATLKSYLHAGLHKNTRYDKAYESPATEYAASRQSNITMDPSN